MDAFDRSDGSIDKQRFKHRHAQDDWLPGSCPSDQEMNFTTVRPGTENAPGPYLQNGSPLDTNSDSRTS